MNKKQYNKEKQDALPESVSISADDFNIFSTFQHVFFLLNKILIIYAVVLFDKTKTKPTENNLLT